MPESQCNLCAKPGKFEKLFHKCKHGSACYDCLRDRYVIKAQQDVYLYPLKCFHPECNLVLRSAQMKRFVRSEQELQTFCQLTARAKNSKTEEKMQNIEANKRAATKQARMVWLYGSHWQVLGEALGEEEVCRCPECEMIIIKDGGCDHMDCFCGASFGWNFARKGIDESCRKIEEEYSRFSQVYAGKMVPTEPSLRIAVNQTQTKKAKRAPLIRIDDNDNSEVYDCEDYSAANDESPDSIIGVETAPQEDCTQSANISDGFDIVTSDFDSSFPSISPVASAGAAESHSQTAEEQDDFQVLELASDASDDSWTQFDPETDSCDHDFQTTSISSQTTTPWEEVSEVSSVVSFNSKTGMSFLEAARHGKTSNSNSSWKEVSKVPRPMTQPLHTIAEDRKPMVVTQENNIVDQMFDSHFMFDGAKGSRGGKQKFKTKVV